MPKVDALPLLQEKVRAYVHVASACELGRVSNLHRSTVLRFCNTGRATSATARKLSAGIAALSMSHGRAVEDAVNPHPVAVNAQQMPQDLKSLRSMLQTLISLIDGQYGRFELTAGANSASTGTMPGA